MTMLSGALLTRVLMLCKLARALQISCKLERWTLNVDLKTDSNMQLLKCKMEAAGHGGMSGRDNSIIELAEEYSFILKNAELSNV